MIFVSKGFSGESRTTAESGPHVSALKNQLFAQLRLWVGIYQQANNIDR
jgi:hypothetical protein